MKDSKIFLLGGKARSGKDTVAKFIKNHYENENKKVVIFGFSDYIKDYAMKVSDWDGSDETKPRELLQMLGTDIIRKNIDENFFINRVCDDITVYKYFFDVIIISGARYPNELDMPKSKFDNVYSLEVERPNFENNLTAKEKKHATETTLKIPI